MQVDTVTTSDGSLLRAVRSTIASSDDVLLCVAFVQEKGLHLIADELKELSRRRARARLLMTTHFSTGTSGSVGTVAELGLDVRILNPGPGQTFHPKLYLGKGPSGTQAVIGSANLTGGLVTNIEVGVALRGGRSDAPLTDAWTWAERLWHDERATSWIARVAESVVEVFEPGLYEYLQSAVAEHPVFMTLGPVPRRNHVVDLTPAEVFVETERSMQRVGRAEPIPAWMFNLAWDRLRTHGTISNRELLDDMRIHRSSAVCAILARLPGVERVPGREIRLAWQPGT